MSAWSPTVAVVMPVYNEEQHLPSALRSVLSQSYPWVTEILVVDGGSDDQTRMVAAQFDRVRVLDNPRRLQAAALNIGLAAAKAEVIVRVDGHCLLASDYVERAIEALSRTGASLVGGAMTPLPGNAKETAIAAAMGSPVGAGPARFHVGGASGWVDTVYLGVYRTEDGRRVGGYAEDVGVNEDAEFAIRMGGLRGVWFDCAIQSAYLPRSSTQAVARQFYRYGLSRAATAWRHPRQVAVRQFAAPALMIGLVSPRRRSVAMAYAVVVAGATIRERKLSSIARAQFAIVLPVMHISWAFGFFVGLVRAATGRRPF